MKLYFPEQEFRALGLSEPAIAFLRTLAQFIQTQQALSEAQGDIDAQADSIADLAANDVILDGRIDAYDALGPFVRQDQAARPSHTPFAGVTASNPPTQAEVQAISDALVSQSTTIAGLLTATDTVNLLT